MVSAVALIPKPTGMKQVFLGETPTETEQIIAKLQKETYFENIVSHDKMKYVNFSALAAFRKPLIKPENASPSIKKMAEMMSHK